MAPIGRSQDMDTIRLLKMVGYPLQLMDDAKIEAEKSVGSTGVSHFVIQV
jgi:hypothetical protein